MAKKISSSVGKGGKNKPEDTQLVQELLNGFAKSCGFKKLDVDGLIGPKTISAIAAFQEKAVGMARPDSRIDPGGESLATLNKGPKKVEDEAKKKEKAESKEAEKKGAEKKGTKSSDDADSAGTKGGGKPQVKGEIRGLDKKLLAILEEVSAHYGKPIVVEAGKQESAPQGTELWDAWVNKLKRGTRDPKLKRDEKTRQQLDVLYEEHKDKEFFALANKALGGSKKGGGSDDAHAKGRAVDIRKSTDSKVVAALESILRRENEGNVIHFDDGGKSLPAKITDAMKKQWA